MLRLWITIALAVATLTLSLAQSSDDLVHTVDAGETLIAIANAYGVSLEQVLSLNGLDPEAYLQIGQLLIVIPADQLAVEEEAAASDDLAPAAALVGPLDVSGRGSGALPPAPVIMADAPMKDPADMSPEICFGVYLDDNQNAMRDPAEIYLAGGQILLFDKADVEQWRATSAGDAQPGCRTDVARALYRMQGNAPAGYGLTSAGSLELDLRAGGRVRVEFGVKPGAPTFAPIFGAPADVAPEPANVGGSVLQELGGVFVLLLAGAVLALGAAVSLFVRWR